MLYEFITSNRDWLLERCKRFREERTKVAQDGRTDDGIARFLDQLTESLRIEIRKGQPSQAISGSDLGIPSDFEIGTAAATQGRAMEELGFSIMDVVHSYGDICHAIVELAMQQSLRFEVNEYRLLNRCLDNAVASAVAEFSYQHDAELANHRENDENRRLATLGNELRNQLGTATLAVAALKTRELTLGGTTGTILERSLNSLGKLVDDMLRMAEEREASSELLDLFALAQFMDELKTTLEPTAIAQSRRLSLSTVDPRLGVKGSRDTLQAAVTALLQAAFQITQEGDEVAMHAYANGPLIRIDIVCPGATALPQAQQLALAITRKMVEDMQGELATHGGDDLPLSLSISLPRWTLPN